MTRLEEVSAGDKTHSDQYNEFYRAVYNGTVSYYPNPGSYTRRDYNAHAHFGPSLDPGNRIAYWLQTPSYPTLSYPYQAGSAIVGTVSFPANSISVDKLYAHEFSAIKFPDYASQITIHANSFICATLPANDRSSSTFTGVVFQLPDTAPAGSELTIYAYIINSTGDEYELQYNFNWYNVSTSANVTSGYTVTKNFDPETIGNTILLATGLRVPTSPAMVKVTVWRGSDSRLDDILLTHFIFYASWKTYP